MNVDDYIIDDDASSDDGVVEKYISKGFKSISLFNRVQLVFVLSSDVLLSYLDDDTLEVLMMSHDYICHKIMFYRLFGQAPRVVSTDNTTAHTGGSVLEEQKLYYGTVGDCEREVKKISPTAGKNVIRIRNNNIAKRPILSSQSHIAKKNESSTLSISNVSVTNNESIVSSSQNNNSQLQARKGSIVDKDGRVSATFNGEKPTGLRKHGSIASNSTLKLETVVKKNLAHSTLNTVHTSKNTGVLASKKHSNIFNISFEVEQQLKKQPHLIKDITLRCRKNLLSYITSWTDIKEGNTAEKLREVYSNITQDIGSKQFALIQELSREKDPEHHLMIASLRDQVLQSNENVDQYASIISTYTSHLKDICSDVHHIDRVMDLLSHTRGEKDKGVCVAQVVVGGDLYRHIVRHVQGIPISSIHQVSPQVKSVKRLQAYIRSIIHTIQSYRNEDGVYREYFESMASDRLVHMKSMYEYMKYMILLVDSVYSVSDDGQRERLHRDVCSSVDSRDASVVCEGWLKVYKKKMLGVVERYTKQ